MDNQPEEQELQPNPEADSTASNEGEITPINELTAEEIANLKKKAEVSSQNFERAKKAEEELKKLKSEKKEVSDNNLSAKDLISLRDVHEEDVDFILNHAKQNKISVSEAKKDKYVSIYLRERNEERKTAEASHTGKPRGSISRDTSEAIVEKFNKGQIPAEDDDEGIEKLAKAQMDMKLKRLQK